MTKARRVAYWRTVQQDRRWTRLLNRAILTGKPIYRWDTGEPDLKLITEYDPEALNRFRIQILTWINETNDL